MRRISAALVGTTEYQEDTGAVLPHPSWCGLRTELEIDSGTDLARYQIGFRDAPDNTEKS